jgi:WD40 repeat protein
MDNSLPESQQPQPERLGESRRVTWLTRRNKGWAVAVSVFLLAIIGLAAGAIYRANLQFAAVEEDLGSARQIQADTQEKLALAEGAERQFQRESLLERLERLRLTPHSTSWNATKSWSDQAWELANQAAAIGIDDNLRNQAAATLIGLDARIAKRFRETAASSVVFDGPGKRLLMGGVPAYKQNPAEGAKVWDSETKVVLHVSNHQEAGPVAFGPKGAPSQLVAREDPSLLLWNVATQTPVTKYDFNQDQNQVVQWALNGHQFPLLAMTADGSFVAAAAITADEKGVIAVWEGLSGKRLFQIPAQATALAFSPEGKFLVSGDQQGKITLWPVSEGGELEYIQASGLAIQSLAFSPDSRRLAIGDGGGRINIWKLGTKLPPVPCPGTYGDVLVLSFSPDGTLLASGGRSPAKLWDAATGRLLLEIGCEDVITGLAFTNDGRRLAVSSRCEFSQGGVSVWNLDYGRGIQAIRGLAAPASRVCFSPDGRFLAALAVDWQVAFWNLETGKLLRILDAPKGVIGTAGLAFSPDGKRFVCSAGSQAKSWDVATGRELGAWKLPSGWLDILAFHRTGKLLLFRIETKDNRSICLIRSLIEPKTAETVAEIKELDQDIMDAKAPMDGSYIVVEAKVKNGMDGGGGTGVPLADANDRRDAGPTGIPRLIEAFDPLTGRQTWPPPGKEKVEGNHPNVDPTGKTFAFHSDDKKISLVEMPAGKRLELPDKPLTALGPAGQLWVEPYREQPSSPPVGQSLFRRGNPSPLVTLGIGFPATGNSVQFDLSGTHLAWANPDGTIMLCDLEKVRKRQAELGLGW